MLASSMPRGCSVRAFCKRVASALQAFADVLFAICMLAYFGFRIWRKARRN